MDKLEQLKKNIKADLIDGGYVTGSGDEENPCAEIFLDELMEILSKYLNDANEESVEDLEREHLNTIPKY